MMRLAITRWKYQNSLHNLLLVVQAEVWASNCLHSNPVSSSQNNMLRIYSANSQEKTTLGTPVPFPRILAFAVRSWLVLALSDMSPTYLSLTVGNLNFKVSILWDPLLLPCPKHEPCSFSGFHCLWLTVPRKTSRNPTWLILLLGRAALCFWPSWGSKNPSSFTTAHPSPLEAFLKMKMLSKKYTVQLIFIIHRYAYSLTFICNFKTKTLSCFPGHS